MNRVLADSVGSLSALLTLRLHDVRFQWPAWQVGLVSALLVGTAWWLLARELRQRRLRLARFAEHALLPRLGAELPSRSTLRGQWPPMLAMLLLAVALGAPSLGYRESVELQRGLDVVLAIDASASMLAEDERPSRLERLKQEVRRFRASGPGDRIGLIAFAGRSYILTPLTADVGALDLYIDNLSPETLGQGGSAISGAIRQGVELLEASVSGSDRVLVLLSDGELFEPDTDLRAAAEMARARGIAVVAVGFGTTQGSTIPMVIGGRTEPKRDDQGRAVITRYTPGTLQEIAKASGGVFVDAAETDRAGRARDALRTLRAEMRAAQQQRERIPRFAWLVVPALLVLLFDAVYKGQSPAAKRRSAARATPLESAATTQHLMSSCATRVAAIMLTGVGALGACTRPQDPAQTLRAGDTVTAVAQYRARMASGDSSVVTRYNAGTALLLADSIAESITMLEEVRRDAEGRMRARAQYNEGTALLQGARAEARGADRLLGRSRAQLRAYLTLYPDDMDAAWNYELALRRGSGGGGAAPDNAAPNQGAPQPLDASQSDALLRSAARDEREVQARRQRATRPQPPRGGKDW
jgi:Ca-activated chloride channel family protein